MARSTVAQILYSGLGGHAAVAFALARCRTGGSRDSALGFLGIEELSPRYVEECERQSLPYAYFKAIPRRPWNAWPRIHRWLCETRPDVVVLHSPSAVLPCHLYARRHAAQLIIVEHQPNALKRRSEWVCSRLAMLLGDDVVVLTPHYRDELKQALGRWYRPDKVRVIPNGIDTSRFAPRPPDARSTGGVRLGMAARFTGTKRQDVLVAMMQHLRASAPGISWHLALAGDGETRPAIRRAIESAGLGDCITLPGHLDESELAAWLRSLDVYLHSSEGETLSTSLLQAMATRLPIVASDVPGISNLIGGDPPCGLLVERGDPRRFAEAVATLTNTPATANRLARAARDRAEAQYGQDAMSARYMTLIRA